MLVLFDLAIAHTDNPKLTKLLTCIWDLLYINGSLLFFSALTEKIVAVLPKIKCPLALEPHQIQGLDFIHIYPVIQVSKGFIKL